MNELKNVDGAEVRNAECYPATVLRSADGLLLSTVEMVEYLKISKSDFQKLIDGTLYDGYHYSFPASVSFRKQDYWRLNEVRDWELAEARARYENEII